MKPDWKTLSLAMITAMLVTALSGIILSTVIYPEPPWQEILNQIKNNKSSITFVQGAGFSFNIQFIPLWMLIVGNLLVIAALTVVFYFCIQYLHKRKEKDT